MAAANNTLEPTVFVIFGGAGDLTWRKLIPALFDLFHDGNMPTHFSVILVDRVELSLENLLKHFQEGVEKFARRGIEKKDEWDQFAKHIHYESGDFKKLQTYTTLKEQCVQLEREWNVKVHHIFYMATPPSMFSEIPKYLKQAGLADDCARSRLVVEKPIGYDIESARALNATLSESFSECQIFRIDHYLGKETVQNILAFRFANPLFEPIWNRHYVEYVTITAAESIGVEHRGNYYDHAGALRDMVQNHLMQLLCLVAMEPMLSFDADEIRNKKVDVLHAIRPIHQETIYQSIIRGQYGEGWIDGEKVLGYREEDGVKPNSQTETFVALKLFIDNWRWEGVPFYLRTGKRLGKQASEITVYFRAVPHQSFPAESTINWQSSKLAISIQPDEGITMRFQAKYPGPEMYLRPVEMQFDYQNAFSIRSPEAYETLLWDIMKNDPTLFMRADQVEAAWELLMPILDVWKSAAPVNFPNYAAGTWGPEAIQSLLSEGHSWPLPTEFKPSNEMREN